MTESILTSIKKLLGIAEEYNNFDTDIVIHINSVLMILRQMGVGSAFAITGKEEIWLDYLGDETTMAQFNAVKSLIYLRVRMLFDPPTNGTVMQSFKEQIAELEYRVYAEAHWPTMT